MKAAIARTGPAPRAGWRYRLPKRGFDITLAGALLLASLPLTLLAMICAWRQHGIVFASVEAVGPGRRLVRHWRIDLVPVGLFACALHQLALDKVPLLLAILHGSLSFVGPRALAASELTHWSAAPDRFERAPGLVCLAWLRRRGNIDFCSELADDRAYLAQCSLAGDVAILLRALLVSLYGRPAARHVASHTIAGIRLLNVTMDDLLAAILAALKRRQRVRVAFANPDCVNIAARDVNYRRTLEAFDWVCADGIGMKIAGQILARPVRQNLNGSDFFPPLCAALEQGGHSLYLLGAAPGVAAQVAEWLRARYPSLVVAGWHDGYFSAQDEAALVTAIAAARPAVLLVAMGVPRQEQWLRQHLEASGATIGIGVGGLFDFYSGRIARAPQWLRELGGEWLFRLLQEPGRMWRRYLIGNALFLARIWIEKRRAQGAKGRT
jgi:N-acetylglucosaminyldiphosphoundecaprenol N-acetyl-beta-D-mannosaminyltransferase